MRSSVKVMAKPTKGDGNCAFNAFSLGFWKKEVIEQLEQNLALDGETPGEAFAYFIIVAARKGFITLPQLSEQIIHSDLSLNAMAEAIQQIDKEVLEAKWEEIKRNSFELRRANEDAFQVQMAAIMRELAIFLAEKEDAENNNAHRNRTIQPLLSAFHDYVLSQLLIEVSAVRDDIYKRHDFIEKKKFPELFALTKPALMSEMSANDLRKYNALKNKRRTARENDELDALEQKLDRILQPVKDQLVTWWEEAGGYKTFLNEMKKNGKWAGDPELFQLGRHFRTNIDAYQKGSVHHVHIDHGTIPKESVQHVLDKRKIKQLEIRGVINHSKKEDKKLQLLPLTKEQVAARLGAVSDAERVLDLLATKKKEKVPLQAVEVPKEWSAATRSELLQRNVIGTTAQTLTSSAREYKFSNLTNKREFSAGAYVRTRKRIQEIENKNEIMQIWERYHRKAPTISLTNDNAVHWSDCTVVPVAYTESNIYKSVINTFAALEKKKEKVGLKWQEMVKTIDEKEEKKKAGGAPLIKYATVKEEVLLPTTSQDKIKSVAQKTQEILDSQLAKELQQEEYARLKEKSAQEEADARLARQLQDEEYSRVRPV